MAIFQRQAKAARPAYNGCALTLRVLARLLSYPDDRVRADLADMRAVLHEQRALSDARLAELDALFEQIGQADALDAEADYVQLFDSGRRTSLYLFEHVHGDSRDRGPALVDLAMQYERAGLVLADGGMPDHLPVALEYASTQPDAQARAFVAEFAHILNAVFAALVQRRSRYASAVGALLDLCGARAEAVELPAEEAIDDAWAEPEAFAGCSSHGQSRPAPVQPIRIVRPSSPKGAAPGAQA